MLTKTLVLHSLLILQYTLGQCAELRIDGVATFPTVLAGFSGSNDGVDTLSPPLIDTIRPIITQSLGDPVAEVCTCPFIDSNPYTINYDVPGISVALPINIEVPCIIENVSQLPGIFETPVNLLSTRLEPFTTNYPFETPYEFIPNTPTPNFCIETPPIIITSPPSIELPAFSNSFVTPFSNSLGAPTVLNPPIEIPLNNFYSSALEIPTPRIAASASPSLRPAIDILSPILSGVQVAIEPQVSLNSYPSRLLPTEVYARPNIPTYTEPPLPALPPTLPSDSIASTIASIRSIFSSLPRFNPSPRAKCSGGISVRDLAASRGDGFLVKSSSPKPPTGLSILSENTFQGPVSVSGKLPFLGTVGFNSYLPSAGYGSVRYGCTSGNVGILSENPNSFYPL